MSTETKPNDIRATLPRLGLREYWYPAAPSSKVGSKPISVKMLGEDIMLLRIDGAAHAYHDRCPHRGLPLSEAEQHFPGTFSCAYHGWTFDSSGQCISALNEGPESTLPPKIKVRTYPAEERCGLVWVFMGDGEPRPLSADLPAELADARNIIFYHTEEWDCSWLPATENLMDSHDVFVHRRSPFYFFRKLPAWVTVGAELSDDGTAINYKYTKMGPIQDVYPKVGKWPGQVWWRRWNVSAPVPGEYPTTQLRLPCVVRVGFASLMFVRWMVPVSDNKVRAFLFSTRHAPGFQAITYKLYYHLWASWSLLHLFIGQDRVVFEKQDYYAPERLSSTDIGVVKWRRLIASAAARAQAALSPKTADTAAAHRDS
ncbi:MAG: aromatic ring-hydroxylating dioxygenase subunit alpha [Burkholderiaceae bacterium]|nr:aromatic ring-hydroxylating dioxygenase subunit alpha [Burkholderiaceae bacterium]